MGKNRIATLFAVVVALLITAYALNAQDKRKALFSALGQDQYVSCGLDKLDYDEQNRLFEVISAGPVESHLRESAIRYMEEQGWQRTRVVGALATNDAFNTKYLLAVREYELFTLDPSATTNLVDPGVYWFKISGSTWTLLYPDGTEGRFWEKDLR